MQHNILKNKYYLYLTEFFAGMSVMAVELGASRLLAPYFSSSQIVWTIIIGTIMIAMALGNVWGGRRADKDPNPDRLYVRLVIAAGLDRGDPAARKICDPRDLRRAGAHRKHEFSDLGGISCLHGHLCISAVSAGNGDAVSCQIYGRQSDRQRKNRGSARRVQYDRKHYRYVSAHLCDDSGSGNGSHVSDFFGNPSGSGSGLFYQHQGKAAHLRHRCGCVSLLQHLWSFRQLCILGDGSCV